MIVLRRFIVLVLLMFWLGGSTFYASVAVPIGKDVLGSHMRQAMITRHVTWYINLSGVAAMAIFAWDQLATDPSRARRRARWLTWAGMTATLATLFVLHQQLDAMIDPASGTLENPTVFRGGHRLYLYVMTAQLLCGIVWMVTTLQAWRGADGVGSEEEEKKCPVVDFSGVAQSPKSPADGTI